MVRRIPEPEPPPQAEAADESGTPTNPPAGGTASPGQVAAPAGGFGLLPGQALAGYGPVMQPYLYSMLASMPYGGPESAGAQPGDWLDPDVAASTWVQPAEAGAVWNQRLWGAPGSGYPAAGGGGWLQPVVRARGGSQPFVHIATGIPPLVMPRLFGP